VAIYPHEGTFYSDSPFAILRAPWVTPAQRASARTFQRYVAAHVSPQLAARFGFRPADPNRAPVAPVDAAHGADPRQPDRTLALPDPAVLSQIRQSWFAHRKPSNIELVVDTSLSMSDQAKLTHAKEGL